MSESPQKTFFFNETSRELGLDSNLIKKGDVAVFTSMKNMNYLLESQDELDPSSKVLTASLYSSLKKQSPVFSSVQVLFKPVYNVTSNHVCLGFQNNRWSSEICRVAHSDSISVRCQCNMLTRYALAANSNGNGNPPSSGVNSVLHGTSETADGTITRITFVIIVVVTSSVTVIAILSFTLVVIYCRRVKVIFLSFNWGVVL